MTLECELNKPDVPVKWLKDGKELTPDDRVKFSVDQYIHQLVMTDVTLDDTAKYSCVCGDVSTEAMVTVEGENLDKTFSGSPSLNNTFSISHYCLGMLHLKFARK